MNLPYKLALTALAVPLAASPALADQILVDSRGGGDAVTFQGGVDLAASGDVVVLYPGTYVEHVTVDEGIWVVAQQANSVRVVGSLTVRDVPRGEQVVIMDLAIEASSQMPVTAALSVQDCEALVQVSQCEVFGGIYGVGFVSGAPAVALQRARRVHVMGTHMSGARGDVQAFYKGSTGMLMEESRAAIWGGFISGGDGLDGNVFGGPNGPGGEGVTMQASELFLSSAPVAGGEGGDYLDFFGLAGERGGDGIATDVGSRFYSVDSAVSGGAGGYGAMPSVDGLAFSGSGKARFLPGVGQAHTGGRFAFAEETIEMTVRGEPGKRASLYLTTGVPPFVLDSLDPGAGVLGVPALSLSHRVGPLGQIPPSGELSATVNIPALPAAPGILPATFYVALDGGRRALFGAPLPVLGLNCATLVPDCDGSGSSDFCEIVKGLRPDLDSDGQVDGCGADCNANGFDDWIDLANGTSADLNSNLIPDECEPAAASWYVSPTAAPGGTGSPSSPFASLEEAAGVLLPGHEIVLQDGTHFLRSSDARDLAFANVTLRSENGPDHCTVRNLGLGRALSVQGPGYATVLGITFIGGAAGSDEFGGIIATVDADLLIEDCAFEDSRARAGGAVSVRGGGAVIRGSRFTDCFDFGGSPDDSGGALRLAALTTPGAIIDDCLFERNRASDRGGAAQFFQCPLGITVSRCRFFDNGRRGTGSFVRGGAVALTRSLDVRFIQCLFGVNTASEGGAVYSVSSDGLVLSGCTFHGNEASLGAVLAAFGPGNPVAQSTQIHNSILWGNPNSSGRQITLNGPLATLELEWSNVEGGLLAVGLINGGSVGLVNALVDADPLFRDADGPDGDLLAYGDNDYGLQSGSPSVDSGSNALIALDFVDADGDLDFMEVSPFDLVGGARRFDDPITPDTGAGGAPVVDHGALERQ